MLPRLALSVCCFVALAPHALSDVRVGSRAGWQTLSFYDATGQQHGRDRQLQYDPCTVAHFENGEYLCVGGSDCKATLWTKEGVRLSPLAEREEWVWCCVPRPNANYVAVGCNDGTITM